MKRYGVFRTDTLCKGRGITEIHIVSDPVDGQENGVKCKRRGKTVKYGFAVKRISRDIIIFTLCRENYTDRMIVRMLCLDCTEGDRPLVPRRSVIKENIIAVRLREFLSNLMPASARQKHERRSVLREIVLQRFGVEMVEMTVRDHDHIGTNSEKPLVHGNTAVILRVQSKNAVRQIRVDEDLLSIGFKQKSCLSEPSDFHKKASLSFILRE